MKLTRWYPAEIDPVRIGKYEVYRDDVSPQFPIQTFLYWTGKSWRYGSKPNSPWAHMGGKNKWRGIAK